MPHSTVVLPPLLVASFLVLLLHLLSHEPMRCRGQIVLLSPTKRANADEFEPVRVEVFDIRVWRGSGAERGQIGGALRSGGSSFERLQFRKQLPVHRVE